MPLMTAPLRAYLKQQIDVISRARLEEERVLYCPSCFEPYDKGRPKECTCRRGHASKGVRAATRKVASPVAA